MANKLSQADFNKMIRDNVGVDDVRVIVEKMIEQAKNGDKTAAKMILDRVYPALKPESQTVRLTHTGNESLEQMGNEIFAKVARGEITPDAGAKLTTALLNRSQIAENYRNSLRNLSKEELLALRQKKLENGDSGKDKGAIDGDFVEVIPLTVSAKEKRLNEIKTKLAALLYPKDKRR